MLEILVKFSFAHPNPGKRSTENFTKISRQISRHFPPKKPSRTKTTTESTSRYGEKIRYRRSKTLRRGLRNACFSRQKRQENGTDCERLRRKQIIRLGRRTIFSTGGSFGFGREKRRKISLPHFCRVAALTKDQGKSKHQGMGDQGEGCGCLEERCLRLPGAFSDMF